MFMNSQQQTEQVTKNDLFECGFLRTMLASQQQWIQKIPITTQEKKITRKVPQGCLSDHKYMFDNIRVFYSTWWLNLGYL